MGYYAHSNGGDMLILKRDHDSILRDAGKEWPERKKFTDIYELFRQFGLSVDFDSDGNVDDMYYEFEKYYSEDIEALFKVISPYVQDGSYIKFMGEDESMWAFYFDGIDFKEYRGEIIYPGMPDGGPKRPRNNGG